MHRTSGESLNFRRGYIGSASAGNRGKSLMRVMVRRAARASTSSCGTVDSDL
jgi:hypothetical protein